jgi:hypothetical protein
MASGSVYTGEKVTPQGAMFGAKLQDADGYREKQRVVSQRVDPSDVTPILRTYLEVE